MNLYFMMVHNLHRARPSYGRIVWEIVKYLMLALVFYTLTVLVMLLA